MLTSNKALFKNKALIVLVEDGGELIVERVLIGRLQPPNKFPEVVQLPTGLCK